MTLSNRNASTIGTFCQHPITGCESKTIRKNDPLSQSRRSATRLTAIIAVTIFVCEFIDMGILHFLNIEPPWLEALVDCTILVILAAPILYCLIFRPLVKAFHRQKEIEKQLVAYQEILQISNASKDLDVLLQKYTEALKRLTGCDVVTVRVMDWLGNEKRRSATADKDGCAIGEHASQKSDMQTGPLGRLLEELDGSLSVFKTSGGSFYCPELSSHKDSTIQNHQKGLMEVCVMDNAETLAMTPMMEGGVRLGMIVLADRRPQCLSRSLIELVEKSSLQMAVAIQRLRAEDALEQTNKWLEKKVAKRTDMLTEINSRLEKEIAEHKKSLVAVEEYRQKLQRLSQRLLQEEQQGLKQVAMDLHDRIGHSLALIKINLGRLSGMESNPKATDLIRQMREVLNETISDTRTLTFELSPPILYEIGLQSAIEWLAQEFEQRYDLQMHLNSSDAEGYLDENQRFVLFRATRELLFNVVKHAKADKARVSMRRRNGHLVLDVEDNGVGFPQGGMRMASYQSTSFGLFGIKERLKYIGGTMTIGNRKSGGSRVTLQIPVNQEPTEGGVDVSSTTGG